MTRKRVGMANTKRHDNEERQRAKTSVDPYLTPPIMKKTIALLPGDGIGPEVMPEAQKVLNRIAELYGHTFTFKEALIGGAAWEVFKNHFPESTKKICESAEAILFGSVGGPVNQQMTPKWQGCEINALLGIRKYFHFNINLRPARVYLPLQKLCVLRPEIVAQGIDILCVRELSGDVYFGKHQTKKIKGQRVAFDEMSYDEATIRAAAHAAFKAALLRRKKVHSVDKANVLDCSKLWRTVVTEVAQEYPDCTLQHILVDHCAASLIKRPSDFDVLLCPNLFGDILSDESAVFAGSLAMLPSASLNAEGFGLYEPAAGSAPDIAGKGVANPIGMILSAAMLLKYSFGLIEEHDAIQQAVEKALEKGYRTGDISLKGERVLSTQEMGEGIIQFIN